MIGIYNDAGARLPMAYRGLTINDTTEIYPVGIVAVSHQYDGVTEPKTGDGMESYDPRHVVTVVRIEGIVKAESVAQLHDRIEALNKAFDPILSSQYDEDGRHGYLPFTFSVPTTDTTNYPTGLIPMQYYARSLDLPVPRVSKFEGDGARFSIVLQAVDPRRYLQAESSFAITSSSQTLSNYLASHGSFPLLTITMSGPGSATWDVNTDQDTSSALRLNLSTLIAGDVVTVDMERHEIKVNGVVNQGLYVTGGYMWLAPENQLVGRSSDTGITSSVLTWRRAFV